MATGSAQIHIDRPPDEVFAVVGDAANNPSWRKNVVRTEWLDAGPMRVGRRGRQTARLFGREWTSEAEIVEWDPPRTAAWQTVQGPVTVRSRIRVEPNGSGSLVTGSADGSFRGVLGPLLTRLAVPGMVRQASADLAGLRRHLESQPSDVPTNGETSPR
jgi:Polyketide cyclase / dehydrase and lipid transport